MNREEDNFFKGDEELRKWDNQEDKKTEGKKLQLVFGKKRIVLLAGNKDDGKTNNIVCLVLDFRKKNTHTPIYFYGLDDNIFRILKRKIPNIHKMTTLKHLKGKSNSLFIIDEFQKLKLNDRRYKDTLDDVCDMIYHKDKNNRILFCSPNLREINSVIGSRIERWIVKSILFDNLVNGSQLKDAVREYKGNYRELNDIVVPKNKLLILGEDVDTEIVCPYVKEVDNKKDIKDIFEETKELKELSSNDNEIVGFEVENVKNLNEKDENPQNCQEKLSEKNVKIFNEIVGELTNG